MRRKVRYEMQLPRGENKRSDNEKNENSRSKNERSENERIDIERISKGNVKEERNKLQTKDFNNHIKEILLKILVDDQVITQWQYEESLKRLKKGG